MSITVNDNMQSLPVDIPIENKNYGFVIDNRKCIGCHACSVACKSENEVPLSVNRTWVKYVETGEFPNSRRHFQVTRCNHCANPPCTRICPTEAMYQRADGIVEFDSSVCIGCKACMQACPYDAIYIDPDSGTAAKCHYCAHRTEVGLEPACVVVCPEHAIISGDMNDPQSEIAHLLATQKVTVRKPEQGTAPKLFYINGNDVSLHPTATERVPETFMWADALALDKKTRRGGDKEISQPRNPSTSSGQAFVTSQHSNGTMLRKPGTQGQPGYGPIQIGQGRMAEQMVQVAYNAQHHVPWHWPVPAYLVTKGIGAGLFMLLAIDTLFGLFAFSRPSRLVAGFVSLLFIGITTGLLVYDLEKPERFWLILRRAQWKSWLTRGAVLLIGFSVVAGVWWLLELASYVGLIARLGAVPLALLMLVGFCFALGVAVYTAFLFAQAEGRDLWQSPLLPFHLVVQAFVAGSGVMLLLDLFLISVESSVEQAASRLAALLITFMLALVIDLFITLAGEFGIPHASEVAARAAHNISHGKYRNYFWYGSVLLGHIVPIALALLGNSIAGAIAGICAIVGLYLFEYAFVMAPQEIANS